MKRKKLILCCDSDYSIFVWKVARCMKIEVKIVTFYQQYLMCIISSSQYVIAAEVSIYC